MCQSHVLPPRRPGNEEGLPRARTSARRDQPSITDRMQKEVDEYTKLPAAVPGKDYRKLHKITHPVLSFLHSV